MEAIWTKPTLSQWTGSSHPCPSGRGWPCACAQGQKTTPGPVPVQRALKTRLRQGTRRFADGHCVRQTVVRVRHEARCASRGKQKKSAWIFTYRAGRRIVPHRSGSSTGTVSITMPVVRLEAETKQPGSPRTGRHIVTAREQVGKLRGNNPGLQIGTVCDTTSHRCLSCVCEQTRTTQPGSPHVAR